VIAGFCNERNDILAKKTRLKKQDFRIEQQMSSPTWYAAVLPVAQGLKGHFHFAALRFAALRCDSQR